MKMWTESTMSRTITTDKNTITVKQNDFEIKNIELCCWFCKFMRNVLKPEQQTTLSTEINSTRSSSMKFYSGKYSFFFGMSEWESPDFRTNKNEMVSILPWSNRQH